tara:strand:+ start:528 stop:1325 length:798 start_codon:yes stop_codon:yes gene_type:complete
MNEQKTACETILKELKADLAKKGTKRKKIDHWKSFACQAIGISKMGSARWLMIVNYGVQKGYFKIVEYKGKEILTPCDTPHQPDILSIGNETPNKPSPNIGSDLTPPEEKTPSKPKKEKRDSRGYYPSEYVTGGIPKTTATRPKRIADLATNGDADMPKLGDIIWVHTAGSSWQGEVIEVSVGALVAPLKKKDGHWTYKNADQLFDTKKEADQKGDAKSGRNWSTETLDQKTFAEFRDFQEHREAFLTWLESQSNQEDEIDLSDL